MGAPQVAVVKTGSGFCQWCRHVSEDCTERENQGRESIQGEGYPPNEQRILSPLTRSHFGWGGGGGTCALKKLIGGCGREITQEPEEVIGVDTYFCVCVVGTGWA